MEFWLDKSKIAYATKSIGTIPFALDVWEENRLVGSPFRFTASFMRETDVYLTAKNPHAVERAVVENITKADEEVAASVSLPAANTPTRPTGRGCMAEISA